jgi:hypothetical protein
MASGDRCNCGSIQTMDHIISPCPLTKLEGGLPALHMADQAASDWLSNVASNAFAKLIKNKFDCISVQEMNE